MYVYILKTLNTNPTKYYIGITAHLKNRLQDHNCGKCSHTKKFRPWKLKNAFWFEDKSKAFAFEKYLKSGSGRTFAVKHF